MKKIISFLTIFSMLFFIFPAEGVEAASIVSGDLIKASQPAVYYYGSNGKRYVFPNEKTYKTWYQDFSTVKTITDEELAAITIGGNATYRPGVKMVKIQTDPKVYAVAAGGVLRWVKTEALAISLFGADWNVKIDDVPDAFFINYTVGAEINAASDYDAETQKNSAQTINSDKNLQCVTDSIICGLSIVNAAVSGITSSAAKISWQTNAPAKGELQYGMKPLGTVTPVKVSSAEFLSAQSVSLSNLAPETTYYYKITAETADGSKKESEELSFTTLAGWGSYNLTNSSFRQKNPSVFASADNFGAVWTDDSSGDIDEIKFGIIGKDGKLIVGPSVASYNIDASINSSIAWSGMDFGVVWEDYKITNRRIYFVRLDTYGGRPFVEKSISNTVIGHSKHPKIVWNGTDFGIFWWDSSAGADYNYTKGSLYYQKISQTGQIIGSNTRLQTSLSNEFKPATVWGNGEYATVWADDRNGQNDIYFLRNDESGNILGDIEQRLTETTGESINPEIYWDGLNYGVVWQEKVVDSSLGHYEIYYQRLSSVGDKIGNAIRLTTKTSGDSESPKIIKNGDKFGMVWADYRGSADRTSSDIYFAEINGSGEILTAEQNVSGASGLSIEPSIAVLNGSYNITYTDYRDGNYEIYSAVKQ
jgi:hypothetical protein